jgi:hypothetical protein
MMSWKTILKARFDHDTATPLQRSYNLIMEHIDRIPDATTDLSYTENDTIEGVINFKGKSGDEYTIEVTPDNHRVYRGDTWLPFDTADNKGSIWHGDRLSGILNALHNDDLPQVREQIKLAEEEGKRREENGG